MTPLELIESVSAHSRWLNGNPGGMRVDYSLKRLCGYDFSDVNLTDAKLVGADLSGCSFRGAVMHNVDLFAADLSDASLEKADFTNANLRGVNFSGANLSGAILRGADLRIGQLMVPDEGRSIKMHVNGKQNGERAAMFGADLSGAKIDRATIR